MPHGAEACLPCVVVHGRGEGPVLWVSGAIHGDELTGVEVVRQVLESVDAKSLNGTLLCVPMVNVFGAAQGSRYLPDRRDLNRSFPGSARGSLAGRLAQLFITEIVKRSDVGIDVHSGSDHRHNLPHLRANLEDPGTLELARAFGAPLIMDAPERHGSLRAEAALLGARVLLFEGGGPPLPRRRRQRRGRRHAAGDGSSVDDRFTDRARGAIAARTDSVRAQQVGPCSSRRPVPERGRAR